MATDFTMVAGDTKRLRIAITDADGTAVNLSGASARWRMARGTLERFSGTAVLAKTTADGSITITDTAGGVLTVHIDPADTQGIVGEYVHELEVVDISGDVATVLQGKATIKRQLVTS